MNYSNCPGVSGVGVYEAGDEGHVTRRGAAVRPRKAGKVGLRLPKPEHWEGTERPLALMVDFGGWSPGNRVL